MYTTKEVAKKVGVHRDTILRWLREGKISEPNRDRNGWRKFSNNDINDILSFSKIEVAEDFSGYVNEPSVEYAINPISNLNKVDWSFKESKTGYLSHSIHPYPAKYIPQIPKTLIRELASTNDTILDPFCGSGTTMVEALRLECNGIGIDANPLSCLISRTKTHCIEDNEVEIIKEIIEKCKDLVNEYSLNTYSLFNGSSSTKISPDTIPFKGADEWFYPHVIIELNCIKEIINSTNIETVSDILSTAFSSIIVTVSLQDSDTRYVRREKKINPGDTLTYFVKVLTNSLKKLTELRDEINKANSINIISDNILNQPEIDPVDLVVCSPPYPNAFSYHLYHRTRMLWLDMDQPKFKKEEIGSHRKYSSKSKNAADVNTFRSEMRGVFQWLQQTLKNNKYACFVIGDSTLRGQKIENDKLIIEVARESGFSLSANIERPILKTKKSFNPSIGKIKTEHIVILKNRK